MFVISHVFKILLLLNISINDYLGSAEGLGMIEAIMEHAAFEIDMDPLEFKLANMQKNHKHLLKHIDELRKWADIDKRKSVIAEFNMVIFVYIYNKNSCNNCFRTIDGERKG